MGRKSPSQYLFLPILCKHPNHPPPGFHIHNRHLPSTLQVPRNQGVPGHRQGNTFQPFPSQNIWVQSRRCSVMRRGKVPFLLLPFLPKTASPGVLSDCAIPLRILQKIKIKKSHPDRSVSVGRERLEIHKAFCEFLGLGSRGVHEVRGPWVSLLRAKRGRTAGLPRVLMSPTLGRARPECGVPRHWVWREAVPRPWACGHWSPEFGRGSPRVLGGPDQESLRTRRKLPR